MVNKNKPITEDDYTVGHLTRLRPPPKFGQISSLKTDCSAQGLHRDPPGYQNQARPILHNPITLQKFKLKTIINYEQKCEARI